MASFGVDTAACIRSRTLEITEEEALAAAHGVAVRHTASKGDGQLAILGYIYVEVGTIVQSFVVECLILVAGECLEQGILIQETCGNEVTYPFGTAFHIDVCLFLPC